MRGKRVELSSGDRWGRLLLIRELEPSRSSGQIKRMVECRCDCGTVKVYQLGRLRNGGTKSCGCLARELAVERGHKYGGSRPTHGGAGTPEYHAWISMKHRCYDASNSGYKYYGARGISVCDRWLESFPAFLEDMGRRPSAQHSIDRIDTNGNYEPINCRWATRHQQARNRRNNVLVEYQGEQMCVSEVAERVGDTRGLVRSRLERGWDAERAVSEPVIDKHHSRDGAFYRVPISKRTPEWYREYARREKEPVHVERAYES